MFKFFCKKKTSPTEESSSPKNLNDYLKELPANFSFRKIQCEIDKTYTYIVREQPIGSLLFKKFCLNEDGEIRKHIQLILDTENCNKKNENLNELLEKKLSKHDRNQSSFVAEQKSTCVNRNGDFADQAHKYLNKNAFKKFRNSSYYKQYVHFKCLEKQCSNENWFTFENHLSCGSYGNVQVCSSKLTGTKFACKYFDKARLELKDRFDLILHEKQILQQIHSRFVLNLICTFETDESVCMVMNLMSGGDLKYHIKKGLSFERVQFYAAEIICGIVYLHSKNIAHLDLKPTNILLDHNGHVRIGDLGSACIIEEQLDLEKRVGTQIYSAPEVIRGKNISLASDWFSFGCILYEMISGKHPFKALGEKLQRCDIVKLILHEEVYYGIIFSIDSKNICSKLLLKSPATRVPMDQYSLWIDNLKKEPFFDDLNWDSIENGSALPPFKPKPDYSCFDEKTINDGYVRLPHWKPSGQSRKFYKTFCTGVESINWQNDVIDSNIFDELNLPE